MGCLAPGRVNARPYDVGRRERHDPVDARGEGGGDESCFRPEGNANDADPVAVAGQVRDPPLERLQRDLPRAGVLAGYFPSGDARRGWQFRSPGRGGIDWEAVVRTLNDIGYTGPLSVDWHDAGMDREYGAAEACRFVRGLDFDPPGKR